MKTYSAVVVDNEGKKRTLVEESISPQLLEDSLYTRGFYVLKIIEGGKQSFSLTPSGLSKKFILDFTYNVYTLLEFGIDINEVIRILSEIYVKGKEAEFVGKTYSYLKKGEKLSNAIKNYSKDFGSFYISMVSSGEASGKLSESFKLLFMYLKTNEKIKEKILVTSVYPAVLLFLGFAAIHLLLFFIIPNFGKIYQSLDFNPPVIISFVMGLSDFLLNNIIFYFMFLMASVLALVFYFRSPFSKPVKNFFSTRLPVISKINRLRTKIKTSFSIEILLKGGSSLEDSLMQLCDIETNDMLRKEYKKSLMILKEGGSVKDAFVNIKEFDRRDLNIVEISESISKTREGFEKLRQDAEYSLESYLEAVFKLFEPVIMILIAVIIFFLMYLVISPTLNMLEKL